MKILIATDKMDIGGAETHIFTLINELRKHYRITLISSGGVYFDVLKTSGIRCVIAPFDKRDLLSIRKSFKIMKCEMNRADIVHTHTRFTSFLAKKVRGKNSFPRIVTTAHLNFPLFPFGRLAFWGDGTLAVSEDIRDYLKKSYQIKKEDVILTKNALNLSEYRQSNLTKKLIVHTSRIDTGRAKCAFLLTDLATELLSRHKDWRIMIIGSGNRFEQLSKRAKEANDRLGFNGVILTGARSDIPPLLEYGSIFVGVSRSALEGMASGLPTVIAGDEGYGGIINSKNFDLLSYTNFCARGLPEATAEKLISDIECLISSAEKRTVLGLFVREKIRTSYDAKSMTNDAIACYKTVARRPSVCLAGYFGYMNLGDEETLRSAINVLKRYGISDITVLRAASASYKCTFPFIKEYNRTNANELIRAIECADILILCGGNLLQNETSMRSLIYYEEIIRIARTRGKRTYILASGFGEIHGAFAKRLLKRAISSADFCGCRTSYDLEIAKKINPSSAIMPDLCFLLSDVEAARVRKTSFVWVLSKNQSISPYVILKISKARNLTPIALNLFEQKDREAAAKARDAGIEVITPRSYEKALKIISNSAFSISERLHGAVFSILAHTPTYVTEDSEKNRALLLEISARKGNGDIVFPYTEKNVTAKKEIGASDSDFNYVIDSLRHDVLSAMSEIFNY